jgi:hypothetical protein
MKIRFSSQDLRIRLDVDDLTFLKTNQYIKEELNLGNGSKFEFLLVFSDHTQQAIIHFNDGILKTFIPEVEANKWLDSATEGLYHQVGSIKLSVEKDKGCTH